MFFRAIDLLCDSLNTVYVQQQLFRSTFIAGTSAPNTYSAERRHGLEAAPAMVGQSGSRAQAAPAAAAIRCC